jgi:YVTN family beta-propeller protein
MKKINFLLYCFFAWITWSSCSKNYPVGPQCVGCLNEKITDSLLLARAKLMIVNEGNYGWGNGSLSIYLPYNKMVLNNVFESVNDFALGDIPFSISIIDELAYLVVNNSDKIIVFNPKNLEYMTTINGLHTPRYIQKVGVQVAYVTSLFGDKIYVVDLLSLQIVHEIAATGWTEQLVYINGLVFVVNYFNNKVLVINPENHQIIKEIQVGIGPNSLVVDKRGDIWVLCSGGFQEDFPRLIKINSINFEVNDAYIFNEKSESPSGLKYHSKLDELFFLNGSLYSSKAYSNISPEIMIDKQSKNVYAFEVDTNINEFYLSDALNYVQQGIVYRYNSNFQPIDSFSVGVNPGCFLMYYQN